MTQEVLSFRDEMRLHEKKNVRSVWTNLSKTWQEGDDGQYVRPLTIHIGEKKGPNGPMPTWEDPVYDIAVARAGWQAIRSGSTSDLAKATVDPYIGQWQTIAHEYDDLLTKARQTGSRAALKSAGVGFSEDFNAMDIINITPRLLGDTNRTYVLEQAVTEIAVPNLTVSYDSWTKLLASEGIGEGVPPVLKLGGLSRQTFDLPKDGGGVALTFEAQARSSHDLMRLHIDSLTGDLRRVKAQKIATELETAPDVTGQDFGGFSGGDSTYNPGESLGGVADTIDANNGTFDTIVSHDKVFREYMSNTWVAKFTTSNPQTAAISNNKTITGVPGLPGITWYIDNLMSDTMLTMYEKASVVKFQGPVRTAVMRQEMEDIDAFRIFDFNLPKIINEARIRNVVGVTTP